MCGRYVLTKSNKVVQKHFELFEEPKVRARYNVAPTDGMPVVRMAKDSGKRELAMLRWGLIPMWSKDASSGAKMINARSETVAEKPAFRNAVRQRRCLVPADGFYEWKRSNKKKLPYLICRKDREILAYAGLWERWRRDSEIVESFTILTTPPNDVVRPLHDRMPLILQPKDYALWLDRSIQEPKLLEHLFVPFPAELTQAFAVSTKVNNVRYDEPDCVDPIAEDGQMSLL